MNPADKFLIFFGLLDLFYGYPLDFGPIIHPQFLSASVQASTSISWFRFWFDFGVNYLKEHFYILIQILV